MVAIASKRFREEGLGAIGIAEMMKEAGFTIGGLYKHFASRDDLVAEALVTALEMWKRQVNAATSGGPPVTYESRSMIICAKCIVIIQVRAAR